MAAPNRPVATRTRTERGREAQVEPLREVGRRGSREPRSTPAARVREERELADDERVPADIEQRPVRPTLLVGKDPQLGHGPGESVGGCVVVGRPNPEEHDEPAPDFAHGFVVHAPRHA